MAYRLNQLILRKNNSFLTTLKGNPQVYKEIYTCSKLLSPVADDLLPIPNNIDVSESTRFSPHRSRDISSTVIVSHYTQRPEPMIDITVDNTLSIGNNTGSDPHVQSYDCFGAISLNSAMQSNVPSPFGGLQGFTHLNMPGGQWSQESKFTSQNLQNSHYRSLRQSTRQLGEWSSSLPNDNSNQKANATNWKFQNNRRYCTKSAPDNGKEKTMTKTEQLKLAIKDYGVTVVVFHVAISLASLGSIYALISGGVSVMPLLDFLGLSSSGIANKIATGASTFVVAYAIHKVFAPVRISITLGATPFIVRYLRSKGILKQAEK